MYHSWVQKTSKTETKYSVILEDDIVINNYLITHLIVIIKN